MKKIIIGIPHLNSGGVEVSLIRLLKELSKDKKLEITILMLKKEGMYLKDIPSNIKIQELKYTKEIYSFNKSIKDIKKIKNFKDKITFFIYRNKLRKYQKKSDYQQYYNTIIEKVIPIKKEYDLAIDWHGYGHFITAVVANINAKKRAMWIHDEKNEWFKNIEYLVDKYDKIFCVGQACLNNLLKNHEYLKDKTDIFYNMTDYKAIREKSQDTPKIKFNSNTFNIITVGRFAWQKAYDVAVLIAEELKKRKFNFHWYFIGDGVEREKIETSIKEKGLTKEITLLGVISNPFPYIKQSDLYVTCSRHEGYCLATLEAKILGKIIVATDIESNQEQIENGINGILCRLDKDEFASKIIEISKDKKTAKKIVENLAKENFDNKDELKKLYKLISR